MLITLVMITFQIQIAKFFSSLYMFVVHIRSRNMEKETNYRIHPPCWGGQEGTEGGRQQKACKTLTACYVPRLFTFSAALPTHLKNICT